jgi:hypothetical protein
MANFPTRKLSKPLDQFAFPNDLLSNVTRPYVTVQFISYRSAFYAGTTVGGALTGLGQSVLNLIPSNTINLSNLAITPTGSISLPIPKKINENQQMIWNETSLLDRFMPPPQGSALTGIQVNPFQLLYFQRPAFKEYSFSWSLTPNTPEESGTLRNIVREFKRRSLPTAVGPLFDYPDIALIKFYPNNLNEHIIIKPCAITSVQFDHAGTTVPSFFKNSRGAPVAVNITLQLKEIDIWTQNDYTGTTAAQNLGRFGAALGAAAEGFLSFGDTEAGGGQ